MQADQNGFCPGVYLTLLRGYDSGQMADFGARHTGFESGLCHFLSAGSQLRENTLLKLSY